MILMIDNFDTFLVLLCQEFCEFFLISEVLLAYFLQNSLPLDVANPSNKGKYRAKSEREDNRSQCEYEETNLVQSTADICRALSGERKEELKVE